MPITFHQFNRKGWSLFAALGKEVRIGVLSVATLGTAVQALAGPSHATPDGAGTISGEADTLVASVILEEAAVTAASLAPMANDVAARQVMTFSRDDIAAAGVTSINDLLKLCAGVDVRQRGPHGVQSDISVSGGTFDQVSILLNGVNISSPHTGHLSADLPVSPSDIERVEVLEGAAARVYGTQAFTGVINIVTNAPSRFNGVKGSKTYEGYIGAAGGMYGYAGVEGHASAFGQYLSAGYTRADGATPHSAFQSTRAFYRGAVPFYSPRADRQDGLEYQLSYSNKPYDANTFYGAGSRTQWERNERWTAALGAKVQAGRVHLKPMFSWNYWRDHYQWIKGSPVGENRHVVNTFAFNLPGHINWIAGTTAFGAEVRHERIISTKLGEPIRIENHSSPSTAQRVEQPQPPAYPYAAHRTNINAYLEHDIVLPHWTFSAGVLAALNTGLDAKVRFYPGVDAAWRPHRHWTLSAGWNMALRMPTFTDLYYSGANIEGNSHLRPERTSDVSLRLKWQRPMLQADLSATYSHRTDMIDWVIYAPGTMVGGIAMPDDKTFRSGNFTLDQLGIRFNAAWLPRQRWTDCALRSVRLQYAWLNADTSYPVPVTASKYAMEYLRHKVVLSADGRIWRGLSMSLSWRWQQRTGLYADAYSLVDAGLKWEGVLTMARCQFSQQHPLGYEIYVEGKNILNHHYREYGYVEQPGAWVIAGVRLKL